MDIIGVPVFSVSTRMQLPKHYPREIHEPYSEEDGLSGAIQLLLRILKECCGRITEPQQRCLPWQ